MLDDGDLVSEVSVDAVVSMLSPLPTSSFPSSSGDSYLMTKSSVIVPVPLAQPAVYNLHLRPPPTIPLHPFSCLVCGSSTHKTPVSCGTVRGVAGHKSLGPVDDNVLTNAPGSIRLVL